MYVILQHLSVLCGHQVKYCDVLGVGVTNNNGFWILWVGFKALLYNYNQL
jgi:hypothetical protein